MDKPLRKKLLPHTIDSYHLNDVTISNFQSDRRLGDVDGDYDSVDKNNIAKS